MAVRQSKFRHVFGTEANRIENYYEGFRVTNCASDGTFIAANQKYIAFCVDGGGGTFCVIPVSKTGRVSADLPKVSGHKEYVLDMKWNPFDDDMLATCSEDGSIRIWSFEHEPYMNIDQNKAVLSLEEHQRRCTQIVWHPIAESVLMSVSQEPEIRIWNLDDGSEALKISCKSVVYACEFSSKGDRIIASSKDKMFRIYDARTGDLLIESKGHEGAKPQRVVFTFNDTMLFSCGFSRMSERQFACWKINGDKLDQVENVELDTANGVLVPYYDPDTLMMYLAAKGDTVIRYYEIVEEEPYYHYINTFQSKDSQRSLCFIPKRCVDVNSCEVMKFYKIVVSKNHSIRPISFTVPRKSDLFQKDIYPDAISVEAAQDAASWCNGENVNPKKVQMETFFTGRSKKDTTNSSGGLKKGGLKGLKAKKDAKKADAKPVPTADSPEPAKSAVKPRESSPSTSPPSKPASTSSSSSISSGGANPKDLQELKDEIKTLKDNEKKMQKDIKSLTEKLKDYDKLTGDIKLLCDAVKKNDGRLNSLEALVQEESDEGEE